MHAYILFANLTYSSAYRLIAVSPPLPTIIRSHHFSTNHQYKPLSCLNTLITLVLDFTRTFLPIAQNPIKSRASLQIPSHSPVDNDCRYAALQQASRAICKFLTLFPWVQHFNASLHTTTSQHIAQSSFQSSTIQKLFLCLLCFLPRILRFLLLMGKSLDQPSLENPTLGPNPAISTLSPACALSKNIQYLTSAFSHTMPLAH